MGNWLIKTLWISMAILFCSLSLYSTYYVTPERGITYGLGLVALTFPIGMAVPIVMTLILKLLGVNEIKLVGDLILNLLMIISGYWQWFVLLPFIRNKMK